MSDTLRTTGVPIVTGNSEQDAFLRVRELEGELIRLEKDGVRLDWLDKHRPALAGHINHEYPHSLRAAIDAERGV